MERSVVLRLAPEFVYIERFGKEIIGAACLAGFLHLGGGMC